MSKVKFTGSNISAAILVLCYFLPWISLTVISMSGLSITSDGIPSALFAYFIHGVSRLFMVLAIVVPLSGALILYQNVSGVQKFSKYFKLAHILPAVYLIIGIIGLYFKMKPEIPEEMGHMYNNMSSDINYMAPGVTDVLTFGFYLSVIAAIYLALVSLGRIKDKEYCKYAPTVVKPESPATENFVIKESILPKEEDFIPSLFHREYL
jgi:hypothetical protein